MIRSIKSYVYNLAKKYLFIKNLGKFSYRQAQILTSNFKSYFGNYQLFPPVETICDSTKLWVQRASTRNSCKANYIKLWDSDEKQALQPQQQTSWSWKYQAQPIIKYSSAWVATIENGRVAHQGAVITPDNQLLGDVSPTIEKGVLVKTNINHELINHQLQPAKIIKGRVAVLSFPFAGTNYAHWLLDLLPRIYLIEQAGIDLNTIDYFIVNDYLSAVQIESLTHLGISKNRVLTSQWNPHIQASDLIVPSLVSGENSCDPNWSLGWLKQKFLTKLRIKKDQQSLIYINRKSVSYRRVLNEDKLESLLVNRGFKSLSLEERSIFEQAELLYNASVVVAPHGAGLSNLVFCQPKTIVIELLHHSAVNLMYWQLSNTLNLDYHYILSQGELPPVGVDSYDNFVDMSFDLKEVEKNLNSWLKI